MYFYQWKYHWWTHIVSQYFVCAKLNVSALVKLINYILVHNIITI